jgi:UDP-N-acetylmuramyl pentapeptide phosphotransferase/UDP-N-acetylglucosamine-1-phosphate transferase
MRGLVLVGVLLIVAGLAALTWPVISYTRTEKVVDLGPIEVTADRERRVPVPPLVGGLAVAAGLILVVSSRRNA